MAAFTASTTPVKRPSFAFASAFGNSAPVFSVSFAVFSILVLTVLARHPQAALLTGAVASALFSYIGHLLFAFAPEDDASTIPAPENDAP